MLITTLGTSHGSHTLPRNNTATLIETGDASYLVDCGEPVSGTMRRLGKDFGILRALFVTHMHADQVGGIAQSPTCRTGIIAGRDERQECLPH